MLVGKIASVVADRGFGFIKPASGGNDVFFHKSALKGWIENVEVGQECSFEIDAKADKPRARSVEVKGGTASGGNRGSRNSAGNGGSRTGRGTREPRAGRANTSRPATRRAAKRGGDRARGAATQAGRSSLNRGGPERPSVRSTRF